MINYIEVKNLRCKCAKGHFLHGWALDCQISQGLVCLHLFGFQFLCLMSDRFSQKPMKSDSLASFAKWILFIYVEKTDFFICDLGNLIYYNWDKRKWGKWYINKNLKELVDIRQG